MAKYCNEDDYTLHGTLKHSFESWKNIPATGVKDMPH